MGGEHTSFQLVDHLQGAIPINLLDTDEFYDLEQDPYEVTNLIDSPEHTQIRDRMHDWILEEMDRIRDPYRTFHWSKRSWRDVGNMFYMKQPFAFLKFARRLSLSARMYPRRRKLYQQRQ